MGLLRRAGVAAIIVAISAMGSVPWAAAAPGALPVVSVGDVAVVEGTSRGAWRPAVVPVTLSQPASSDATVAYTVTPDSASAGSDYEPASGLATIATGSMSASIVVQVKGDTVAEPPETFDVTLSAPVGAQLGRTTGVGEIREPGTAGLTVSDVVVVEPDDRPATKVVATVMLPETPTAPVAVDYATVSDTASAPADFLARAGTVTIVPPARSARIQLWVRGDLDVEPDETFDLAISSTDAPVADSTGTITIQDKIITERVSVASDGTQANGASYRPALSDDGQIVAFLSNATNLVAGDTNTKVDVFVHDRATGETTRVSIASDGTESDADSGVQFADGTAGSFDGPDISSDGRYVTFASNATTLVADDTTGNTDVFVHDRATGQTTRVSVASDGTRGYGDSEHPTLSADGRYVAFLSSAPNLVPGDTNDRTDCFVHDRTTGETTRVSVASDGAQSTGPCFYPAISDDGTTVAFDTPAELDNLGNNNSRDVYAHDRTTGETTRVSITTTGEITPSGSLSREPAISADGRYVYFKSNATNLGAIGASPKLFARARDSGQTSQLTDFEINTFGISPDGRYFSLGSNLRDQLTGVAILTLVNTNTQQGNAAGTSASLSSDARFVAYESLATNLVSADLNGAGDIFVGQVG